MPFLEDPSYLDFFFVANDRNATIKVLKILDYLPVNFRIKELKLLVLLRKII